VSKALGTGSGGQAGWLDLEIIRDPNGAPKLVLLGAAAEFADQNGITEIQISLTHAREYAAANAIAIVEC
jgi:holo-[acyl-carrier protein] synthase